MSEAKHTAGAWAYQINAANVVTVRVDDKLIARLSWNHCSIGEVKANAKLISAAPDMAEALKDLLVCFELPPPFWDNHIEKARAALAKAGVE